MTEQLKIPDSVSQEEVPAQPEGLGEDGYYSLQVRLPIATGEISGFVTTLLKMNSLPEGINLDDPNSIQMTLNTIQDKTVGFPVRGFVSIVQVIGVDTNADTMIFNMAVENVSEMRTWHLDHVAFAQLTMPRNGDLFLANRPGSLFYLTVDFGHNAPVQPASEQVIDQVEAPETEVAQTAAVAEPEIEPGADGEVAPVALPEGDNVTIESDTHVTTDAEVPANAAESVEVVEVPQTN